MLNTYKSLEPCTMYYVLNSTKLHCTYARNQSWPKSGILGVLIHAVQVYEVYVPKYSAHLKICTILEQRLNSSNKFQLIFVKSTPDFWIRKLQPHMFHWILNFAEINFPKSQGTLQQCDQMIARVKSQVSLFK